MILALRALRYAALPGFLPRIRELLGSGFGFVSYSMACVFETARLLPSSHPYLNPQNIGSYGVRHVLGQAALNLRFSRRNTDQIILFGLMLVGFVLLLVQMALMAFALFAKGAKAAALPNTFAGYFESPNPTDDISYIVLDRIFGIPGLFNSCVAQNIPCLQMIPRPTPLSDGAFPQPYHLALQDMLGLYSTGLLVVAAIILAYHIVTLLAEISETGTPFGKRFNRSWAPLRIVFALGLLIPMTYNFNAAQYITLYITKYGSAFATNAWNFFVTSIALSPTNTLAGDSNNLIAKPQYPAPTELIQFMSVAWTCKMAYKKMYDIEIDAYAVRSPLSTPDYSLFGDLVTTVNSYYELQEWYNLGDIVVVFGERDETKHPSYKGKVRPYCGQVTLPSLRVVKPTTPPFQDGADLVAFGYLYTLVWWPWSLDPQGQQTASGLTLEDIAEVVTGHTLPLYKDISQPLPSSETRQEILAQYETYVKNLVDNSFNDMRTKTDWVNDALDYGWGGAGIWYNKIAQANGDFTEAAFNIPAVTLYPEVMEWVKQEKSKNNTLIAQTKMFEPSLADGQDVMEGRHEKDKSILTALNMAYALWNDFYDEVKPKATGNAIIDGINALFKQTGLWTLRDNEIAHPLASMASMGKALLTNSVIAFGAGAVTGVGGVMSIAGAPGVVSAVMANISSFLITLAFIGLVAGITLYYVVPLMPFIYFFFAILGWAKTIFEAMVGVPLWALAHLRYDGEGFPTRQSMYGYYLLLDIFLRPVLIVFGLIASISVFYALARTLNNVFDTVTSNLTGFDEIEAVAPTGPKATEVGSLAFFRGATDQLFFTIIYTVIVYMMGMSCFKLIDLFPNTILRWMGSGAKGLGSIAQEDAGQALGGKIKTGSYQLSDQAASLTGSVMNRTMRVESGT